MGGKSARVKGHSFERKCANALKHIFVRAQRQLEYQESECKGIDLEHTGPFRFQCKKLKAYASVATIKEIELNPHSGEIPVLVTAGDNLPAMAVLPFSDLIKLIEAAGYEEE